MKENVFVKKGVAWRITIAIVLSAIVVTGLVGGVSIFYSRNIVKEQSREILLKSAEGKAHEFDTTVLSIQTSIEGVSTILGSTLNLDELKKDKSYIDKYQTNIQEIVKKFSETTSGSMGTYFYLNPELTGGVYGAWYADKQNNKNFEQQDLGTIDEFTPDNKDMEWYYKPVKAGKSLWLQPYEDPDLKIYMISYVKPIYQGQTLIGVLGMDINFDYFQKSVNDTKVFDTGYASLINENFDVLVSPVLNKGDNFATVDNGSLKAAAEEMSKTDLGLVDYTFKGVNKTLAFHKLSNGYIFMINVPQKEILADMNNLTLIVGGLILLAIIISVIVAQIISRIISKPIIEVTGVIDRTSKLDLTEDLMLRSLSNRSDEIGRMVSAITNMRVLLRDIVKNLSVGSDETAQYAQRLATSTNDVLQSMSSVSIATEELAKGASEQSQISQSGLEKLLDLSDEIDKINNSTSYVKETLNNTNKSSENAIKSINNLQGQFEINNEITKEVTSSIVLLADKSETIGTIINTIKEVAEQTNLLALNAAIEAARAGEQGKGFAVVADEIRKLAEQTSSSTTDIEGIIKEIQNNIGNAKNKIDSSNSILKESNEALAITNKDFNSINNEIKESSSQITTLLTSIDKMTESKNQVVDNIQEIAAIIEESAASTEEVSASLDSQQGTIESICTTSDKLSELASKLDSIVKEFKI